MNLKWANLNFKTILILTSLSSLYACVGSATEKSSTANITISNLSESNVTQAGGSIKISAQLNGDVSSSQIVSIVPDNPYDNITVTSQPSPCALNNDNTDCTFTITTGAITDRTSLGLKKLIITNKAEVLWSATATLNKTSVPFRVIPPYMIYYAHNNSNGYSGNLLSEAQNKGASTQEVTTGIQGADYLCNHDESKPNLPVGAIYKAMVVDGVTRRACYAGDCVFEGVNENIDWVLKVTAAYKNTINAVSMVTNESAIYVMANVPNYPDLNPQPTLAPIIFLPDNFSIYQGTAFSWSGISDVWTSYPSDTFCGTGSGSSFTSWDNSSTGLQTNNGNQFSYSSAAPGFSQPTLGVTQIAAGNRSCSESALVSVPATWIHGLICVQQ